MNLLAAATISKNIRWLQQRILILWLCYPKSLSKVGNKDGFFALLPTQFWIHIQTCSTFPTPFTFPADKISLRTQDRLFAHRQAEGRFFVVQTFEAMKQEKARSLPPLCQGRI
jgi:hypothetical protein